MKNTLRTRISLAKDFKLNGSLYILMLPIIAWYILFHYIPMGGAVMAFQDYSPKGIFESDFVGFKHFEDFFGSYYFGRIVGNTMIISFLSLAIEFTIPIIFALAVNELRSKWFSGLVKSVSVFPHFVSLVIVCGIVVDFTGQDGIINQLLTSLGASDGSALLQHPENFRPIYVASGVWQNMGWDAIIYIAALLSIDQSLYEASSIDGAGAWQKLWHITLPSLLPTIAVMFILRVGNIMNVGFEKIILLYNPINFETSDVISSFVYRKGLIDFQWDYSAAVGLFNSVINLGMLLIANRLSKKVTKNGIW